VCTVGDQVGDPAGTLQWIQLATTGVYVMACDTRVD
jgi:hypothetical protein